MRRPSSELTGPIAAGPETPVARLCLALEEDRRTDEGRTRTSEDFVTRFFPHDATRCEDRIFRHLPPEVRGPILAAWGVRGAKAALRDDDAKVRSIVHDALLAGDLDAAAFEEGLGPDVLVRWVPLADLWSFWRGGKLTKHAIETALVTAYELRIIDAAWFLDALETIDGKLRGTDVLAEGMSKGELVEWVGKVQASGDGSARGLVLALGWRRIVVNTRSDALLATLDSLARRAALVPSADASPRDARPGRALTPAH